MALALAMAMALAMALALAMAMTQIIKSLTKPPMKQPITTTLLGIAFLHLTLILVIIVNFMQTNRIDRLERQVEYLKEGYDDMDRSLDCIIAFEGKLERIREGRGLGCLLPNGVWEVLK